MLCIRFNTDSERKKRLHAEMERRERAKMNFAKKQDEKHEWHRQLMYAVASKTDKANLVMWRRKEDAIRDKLRERSSKLLAVAAAAVRISLLNSVLPGARKIRKQVARQTKAVNTIVKFYRTSFALIHFRRYKSGKKKLAKRFKEYLPMWRLRLKAKHAKTLVSFSQSLSGAGGTAAAIKAYRSKMMGLQKRIRKYLHWKHKILFQWQHMYHTRHSELLNIWEGLRKEKYQKASKEGLELDDQGDPVRVPQCRSG